MFPTTPPPFHTLMEFQISLMALIVIYSIWIISVRSKYGGLREFLHRSLSIQLKQYHSTHKLQRAHLMHLYMAQLLWGATFALFALRMTDELGVDSLPALGYELTMQQMCVIFFFAPVVLRFYYLFAVNIWAFFMRRITFARQLSTVKLMSTTRNSTFISLLIICYLLTSSIDAYIPLYTLICLVVISLIYDIFSSLALFNKENVSIFSWFLYLCTVEIVPIIGLWVLFSHK